MKDVLKLVAVLATIGLVAGSLLGLVNSVTQVDAEQRLLDKISEIYEDTNSLEKIDLETYNKVAGSGKVLDVFVNDDVFIIKSSGSGGYGGDVQLIFVIDTCIITGVIGYSHSETPGLGATGLEEEYLAQYVGVDVNNIDSFTIVKSTSNVIGDIDAIVSATYTSQAIANAANIAVSWYKANTGENAHIEINPDLTAISTKYVSSVDLESLSLEDFSAVTGDGLVKAVYKNDDMYFIKTLGNDGYNGSVQLIYGISNGVIMYAIPFSNKETASYGSEGFTDNYLSQYVGVDVDNVDIFTIVNYSSSLEGDIMQISSATETSSSINNSANIAISWYKINVSEVDAV